MTEQVLIVISNDLTGSDQHSRSQFVAEVHRHEGGERGQARTLPESSLSRTTSIDIPKSGFQQLTILNGIN